jgi:hypothetical protein
MLAWPLAGIVSALICFIFAVLLTQALTATPPASSVTPARNSRRFFRWRYFLIAFIWLASMMWPVAAVLFRVPMVYQLLIGAEISTISLALALMEVIRHLGHRESGSSAW